MGRAGHEATRLKTKRASRARRTARVTGSCCFLFWVGYHLGLTGINIWDWSLWSGSQARRDWFVKRMLTDSTKTIFHLLSLKELHFASQVLITLASSSITYIQWINGISKAKYCTILINSLVTCHSRFWLIMAIIFFSILVGFGDLSDK
jgi:hypothetical protein